MQTAQSGAHALQFQNTTFDVIDRNGVPWLQASQIAAALGYADETSISKVYARHADEFTDEMTSTVNLTVKGFGNGNSEKAVRIFSPRGCYALGMFSRTPVSATFRKWALDVLEGKISVKPDIGKIVVDLLHPSGAVPPAPTFDLSDAIAIYRESMGALLMAHTKKEAHVLACMGATRATGVDLAGMWAPTVKPVATRPPKAPLLPWDNPEKRLLDKLARYLRNATRLPRPKDTASFTAQQCARLLDHGYIPRQTLLKVMHVPASKFNLLIAEGKEAGIVLELDGIEFNYAGTVYVAGGAA